MPGRHDHASYGAYGGHGGRPGYGAPDPDIRIGDAERNEVTEALSQHYSDGRLDGTELKERLDRAMSAKTRADLAGLLTDLPPLGAPLVPTARPRRRHVAMWIALTAIFVALFMPWSGPGVHGPWLWVPHIPWLLVGVIALVVWRRSSHRRYRQQSS